MSEDNVRDISNSPAYLILDDLYNNGKLSHAEATAFRNKYRDLYESVVQTYNDEKTYLDTAKSFKIKVDQEKSKIEKKNAVMTDLENDIRVLDKQRKESRQEIERFVQEEEVIDWDLQDAISIQKQKKEQLEDNYRRILAENEPIIQEMNERIDNYKEDLAKYTEELEKESTEIDQKQQKHAASVKAARTFKKTHHDKNEELRIIQSRPEQIRKSIATQLLVKEELEEERERVQEELSQ